MSYESTIAFVGQWRFFQKKMFFLLCTSIIPSGLVSFDFVFVGDTPDHHCRIPEVNLTQEWLNATIPKEVIKLFLKKENKQKKHSLVKVCLEVRQV